MSGVGYRAAHMCVEAARGHARDHRCIDCKVLAQEWSYTHDDHDELIADDRDHAGMHYSLHPAHYAARCRSCHTRFDKAHASRRRGQDEVPEGARRWLPEVDWDIRFNIRRMAGVLDQPLDDLRELLGFFISAQDDSDLDAATLWAAATHLAARGVGYNFPRLSIVAPSYGSGKSTLLELIARTSHKGEVIGSAITDATIPRILMEEGFATLCFDEATRPFAPRTTTRWRFSTPVGSGEGPRA
jgi:hypothetical protein